MKVVTYIIRQINKIPDYTLTDKKRIISSLKGRAADKDYDFYTMFVGPITDRYARARLTELISYGYHHPIGLEWGDIAERYDAIIRRKPGGIYGE